MSKLARTTKGEALQIFTPNPILSSTFTSPGTYTIPTGASVLQILPSDNITLQLNGTGVAMDFEGSTKETLGIYKGEDRNNLAVTTIVFTGTATVKIWAM